MNLCITEKSSTLNIRNKLTSIFGKYGFHQSDIKKACDEICAYQGKIQSKEFGMQSSYLKTISLNSKKTLKVNIKSSNQRNFTDLFVTI